MTIKKLIFSVLLLPLFVFQNISSAANLRMRRSRGAAQGTAAEQKEKQPLEQVKAAWDAAKEATLRPIGVLDLYENAQRKMREWAASLDSIANTLKALPDDIKKQAEDVLKAPAELRKSAAQIESDFIKQINETLALVEKQRKEVKALNLKGKAPIAELGELEEALLKSFEELEKFLRLLLGTLTEIKNGMLQGVTPIESGVAQIKSNIEALRGKISQGLFGYPGFPQRLNAIATMLRYF